MRTRIEGSKGRKSFIAAVVFMFGALGAAVAGGCAEQSEGDRCDTNSPNSGAEDCAAGLACFPVDQLPTAARTANPIPGEGRCCPLQRATATTEACRIGATQVGDPTVPDAGPLGSDPPGE